MEYGFYERLSQAFPSQINVDLTEICNLECIHCPHSEFKSSKEYGPYSLDLELNKKMVDEVKKYGEKITQYIRYTGNGEPLFHKNIKEILTYAVQNSGTTVTLTTNGTIMNNVKAMMLLETGVHLIDISIDAFENKTYEEIRRKGNLDTTKENVLNLLKLKQQTNSHTKVVVSFVEQEDNKKEVNKFEDYWYKEGVDFVVIRKLHSASGINKEISIQMDKSTEQRYPCLYPWERIVLNSKGYLSYSPSGCWSQETDICDYRKVTIKEVWSSEFYEKLRYAHLSNDFSEFNYCGQCPDWQNTKWPSSGRSYADMIKDFNK